MGIVLTVLHILACAILVLVVLLQQGKGADMGAVFGGSSSTIFGSSGAGNFLTKLTTGAAALFMITSLFLTYLSTQHLSSSVFDAALPEPPPIAGSGPVEDSGLDVQIPLAPPADAEAEGAAPAPGEAAAPPAADAPAAQVPVEVEGAPAQQAAPAPAAEAPAEPAPAAAPPADAAAPQVDAEPPLAAAEPPAPAADAGTAAQN